MNTIISAKLPNFNVNVVEIRTAVLLAKSKKNNAYCVGLIDIHTGELFRIGNQDVNKAIQPHQICYKNGQEAEILDIVELKVMKDNTDPCQPENYFLIEFGESKINQLAKNELLQFLSKKDKIFYNNHVKISHDNLIQLPKHEIYSFQLITPESVTLRIKSTENCQRRLKANIFYRSVWYSNLTITDIEFTEKYYQQVLNESRGYLTLRNTIVYLSLAEPYKGDHYKLICSILC